MLTILNEDSDDQVNQVEDIYDDKDSCQPYFRLLNFVHLDEGRLHYNCLDSGRDFDLSVTKQKGGHRNEKCCRPEQQSTAHRTLTENSHSHMASFFSRGVSLHELRSPIK